MVEGIGNVFPNQMRDFGKVSFQSEVAVIMLQLQHRQRDKHCGGLCSREERETTGAVACCHLKR